MARKRMVTRTVIPTVATVMVLDTETGEGSTMDVVLSGTYKDNKQVLSAAKKVAETDTIKVAHVKSTKQVEELRGMDEQRFIELSEVLPPRTKEDTEDEAE